MVKCLKRMIKSITSLAIFLVLFVFPTVGGSAKTNFYGKGEKYYSSGNVDDRWSANPWKDYGRVLVSKDVKDITGFTFKRKGKWHVYDANGKIHGAAHHMGGRKNIKKYWSVASIMARNDSSLFYMDKNNNIWQAQHNETYKGEENYQFVQFFYKKRYDFNEPKPDIKDNFYEWTAYKELKNVERFWIDKYGMAYVKNGKLYSFGTMEFKNLPNYYDTIQYFSLLPTRWLKFQYTLRCHQSIDVQTIKTIHFGIKSMYITQKDGRVIEITAKTVVKNKKRELVVRYKKLNVKNVKIYEDNYYIKKDGRAVIKFADKTYKMKGVKQVLNTYTYNFVDYEEDEYGHFIYDREGDKDDKMYGAETIYDRACFVLKKNGDLYGWGDNGDYIICPEDYVPFIQGYDSLTNYIPFEDRYLIAGNVKKVSNKEFLRNRIFF